LEAEEQAKKRPSTIVYLMNTIDKYAEEIKDIEKLSFDIFTVEKSLGRDHLLPAMAVQVSLKLGLMEIID
jgi:orotidine-5'-phosphate decarboxylase